jgi:hypothetical protein
LHAEQRVDRAEGRVLLELAQVLLERARILRLELHPLRAAAIGLDEACDAFALDQLRILLRRRLELLVLRRMRAVAAARHGNRGRAVAVRHPEVQRGKRAHGKADYVRALDAERVEHAADVVPGAGLRVALEVLGHVGRRVAARVVRNAAVAARKVAHLRLPAAVVAAELVHEHDRRAAARLLEIELDAVVGREGWHNASLR